MGHPDEGLIRAFMDGEAGSEASTIEAHLQHCSMCAGLAQEQETALAILGEGLALADVPPVRDRTRVRILQTRVGREDRPSLWPLLRKNLSKAAAVAVLLTAGAAAALPGSPLREWLAGPGGAVTEDGAPSPRTAAPEVPVQEPLAGEGLEEVGTSLPVKAGGMTIRIGKMMEGAELRVLLVEGNQAGIFAGRGTRFRTEETVLEAWEAPGSVKVEVPRGAGTVEILVDGTLFFRKEGNRVETPGPVLQQAPGEIRFLVPPGNPGG